MKRNLFTIILCSISLLGSAQTMLDTWDEAKVYEIPDLNSKVLTILPKGASVKTTGMVKNPSEYDRYFRIVYNGIEGWIYKTFVLYNDLYYSAIERFEPQMGYKPYASITPSSSTAENVPNNANVATPVTMPIFKTTVYNPYATKVIKLTKKGSGTFLISSKLNGLKMNFIFDTGASDVSISLTEALFMIKNGYLKESDIYGTEYYKIANGEIQEGTKIIIKELEFDGLKLYNVEASVVHNLDAPLLLGQSAISMFGKIQIDYYNNTLTVIK